MHHKSRQSRGVTSEILCLRIKELNFLSQIFKLSKKEVLPFTQESNLQKTPQFRPSMRKTIFGFVLDTCSSHTLLWWQLNVLRGFLMKPLFWHEM